MESKTKLLDFIIGLVNVFIDRLVQVVYAVWNKVWENFFYSV